MVVAFSTTELDIVDDDVTDEDSDYVDDDGEDDDDMSDCSSSKGVQNNFIEVFFTSLKFGFMSNH